MDVRSRISCGSQGRHRAVGASCRTPIRAGALVDEVRVLKVDWSYLVGRWRAAFTNDIGSVLMGSDPAVRVEHARHPSWKPLARTFMLRPAPD